VRAHIRTPWVETEVTCAPGEVVAVMGPNGAGKSTLLKALAGVTANDGPIEVGGAEIGSLPPYRRDVGWVPQRPSLLAHLNARDNAAYALRARGVRKAVARDRAQGWLALLGVGELGDLRPHALSGGQAARVALARALVHELALVLLDEPFVALDEGARAGVRATLREVLPAGRAATLIVTHDPDDVTALGATVLRLERGRAVAGEATTFGP
jgi:molybdate transport system ATP-binding protein